MKACIPAKQPIRKLQDSSYFEYFDKSCMDILFCVDILASFSFHTMAVVLVGGIVIDLLDVQRDQRLSCKVLCSVAWLQYQPDRLWNWGCLSQNLPPEEMEHAVLCSIHRIFPGLIVPYRLVSNEAETVRRVPIQTPCVRFIQAHIIRFITDGEVSCLDSSPRMTRRQIMLTFLPFLSFPCLAAPSWHTRAHATYRCLRGQTVSSIFDSFLSLCAHKLYQKMETELYPTLEVFRTIH